MQGPAIGLGPITFPKYLDRRQIATRTGPYELEFVEFDRWAEALSSVWPIFCPKHSGSV
jgi:uncharacterized lipoprotein YmbA